MAKRKLDTNGRSSVKRQRIATLPPSPRASGPTKASPTASSRVQTRRRVADKSVTENERSTRNRQTVDVETDLVVTETVAKRPARTKTENTNGTVEDLPQDVDDTAEADEKPAKRRKSSKANSRKATSNPGQEQKPAKTPRKTKAERDQEAMPLSARTKGLQHFLGSHVSIAKGVSNSVLNSVHLGGNSFAMFLKSQRQWAFKPIDEDEATLFNKHCTDHQFSQGDHVLPHGSYLVNLASVNPEQHQKSVNSFLDDMQRCSKLGIRLYNFHPGNTNGAPRHEAFAKIAQAIDQAHLHAPEVIPVLETMASNKPGSNVVGGTFEDLAGIIDLVKDKSRVGVCIDTCHVFAAGYDIVTEEGFKETMEAFDRVIGRKYLRAWHLNDSKGAFGSGRDLHANIGTAAIGLKGFWNVMNMSVWGKGVGVTGMPLILETPIDETTFETSVDKEGNEVRKGVEDKSVWAREIKLLESLIGMDSSSEEFLGLETELAERGRQQREKLTAAKEKEKMKRKAEESDKGRQKRGQAQGRSGSDHELKSELSELYDSSEGS